MALVKAYTYHRFFASTASASGIGQLAPRSALLITTTENHRETWGVHCQMVVSQKAQGFLWKKEINDNEMLF